MAPLFSSVGSVLALGMVLALLLPGALSYDRPKARETLSIPLAEDADGLTPQQVTRNHSIFLSQQNLPIGRL